MSKQMIADIIQQNSTLNGYASRHVTNKVVEGIIMELKQNGKFTLPTFGTFTVRKTRARKALDPRSGDPIRVKAGKTVKFKVSPGLRKRV